MQKKRTLGLILIIIAGFVALSNITITGAVIGAEFENYSNLVAIGLFVFGVLLLAAPEPQRVSQEGLPDLILSPEFAKSLRRHKPPKAKINSALSKLQRGSGNRKAVPKWGERLFQIGVDKGGRLFYRMENGHYKVIDYKPSSEHP